MRNHKINRKNLHKDSRLLGPELEFLAKWQTRIPLLKIQSKTRKNLNLKKENPTRHSSSKPNSPNKYNKLSKVSGRYKCKQAVLAFKFKESNKIAKFLGQASKINPKILLQTQNTPKRKVSRNPAQKRAKITILQTNHKR